MLRANNEKRAFWFFLVWVAFVTFSYQPHLAAQDDDMFVVEDDAAPADAPAAKPAADGAAAPAGDAKSPEPVASADPVADADPVVDNGDPTAAAEPVADAGEEPADGGDPASLPALSADPNELLAKVNGVAKSGKHADVIAQLEEHEDAVAESKELLAIYVESLVKSEKPDWNKVNRFAKMLSTAEKGSSLADYAQGMYNLNSKKPDVAKAITFLGKARSAKKPYADAAMAYYMAMGKRFWMIGLALLALPVIVIVKKRKSKVKTVDIQLDFDTASDGGVKAEEPVVAKENIETPAPEVKEKAAETADTDPAAEKKEGTVKKVKKIVTRKVVKGTGATVVEGEDAGAEKAESVAPEIEAVREEPLKTVEAPAEALEESLPAQVITPPPPVIAPSQPTQQPYRPGLTGMRPATPPVEPEVKAAPVPVADHAGYQQPQYTSVNARHQAEIEKIREMSRPGRPAVVNVDPELDALWGTLSRKAMQGKIAPQFRRDEVSSSSSSRSSASFSAAAERFAEPMEPTISLDVSIDLSEEAMKDDLVCKLKMMAITDSELRELFAQKNQRHIPHLIEYILTRPEPVRLAFVAREMGNYEDPAVIDMLASLLFNEDHRVALAAIQGLEKTRKPAAVFHICPFLKSEVPVLAQAARGALSNFGAVKILQAFKDLPGYPDAKIREAGIFVLSRMQGAAVEELLKKMLNDDSVEIRNSVILAMSYQKNPVYIDALREFFRIATESDKTLARKAIVYLQGFVTRKK